MGAVKAEEIVVKGEEPKKSFFLGCGQIGLLEYVQVGTKMAEAEEK